MSDHLTLPATRDSGRVRLGGMSPSLPQAAAEAVRPIKAPVAAKPE